MRLIYSIHFTQLQLNATANGREEMIKKIEPNQTASFAQIFSKGNQISFNQNDLGGFVVIDKRLMFVMSFTHKGNTQTINTKYKPQII